MDIGSYDRIKIWLCIIIYYIKIIAGRFTTRVHPKPNSFSNVVFGDHKICHKAYLWLMILVTYGLFRKYADYTSTNLSQLWVDLSVQRQNDKSCLTFLTQLNQSRLAKKLNLKNTSFSFKIIINCGIHPWSTHIMGGSLDSPRKMTSWWDFLF